MAGEHKSNMFSRHNLFIYCFFIYSFLGRRTKKNYVLRPKCFCLFILIHFGFRRKKRFSSHNFSIHFFSLAGEHKEICSPAKTFLSILFDYFFFDWRTNKICVLRPKFCNSFILLVGDFFFILFCPENTKKSSPAESHFIYSFFFHFF